MEECLFTRLSIVSKVTLFVGLFSDFQQKEIRKRDGTTFQDIVILDFLLIIKFVATSLIYFIS